MAGILIRRQRGVEIHVFDVEVKKQEFAIRERAGDIEFPIHQFPQIGGRMKFRALEKATVGMCHVNRRRRVQRVTAVVFGEPSADRGI